MSERGEATDFDDSAELRRAIKLGDRVLTAATGETVQKLFKGTGREPDAIRGAVIIASGVVYAREHPILPTDIKGDEQPPKPEDQKLAA